MPEKDMKDENSDGEIKDKKLNLTKGGGEK